jgi:hypothetical protein
VITTSRQCTPAIDGTEITIATYHHGEITVAVTVAGWDELAALEKLSQALRIASIAACDAAADMAELAIGDFPGRGDRK